jgi:hypothetical protein
MSRAFTLVPGLLLAAAAVLLIFQAVNMGFSFQDDAYISLRYARNLAMGEGLVYNPGEPVEGYTNFLWTVLAALPFLLEADPEGFLWIAGLASGVLVLAGAAYLTWAIRRQAAAAGIAALLLAAVPAVAAESVMGLETALFAALATLGLGRFLEERHSEGPRPLAGALLGLAALTRPEGYLVAGLAFTADLGRRGWHDRPFWWRWGTFALLTGSHLAFRLAYYGDLVPNTFHAKVGGGAAALERGAGNVGDFGIAMLPVLVLALFGGFELVGRRSDQTDQIPLRWLIPALAVAYVVYVAAVGGDFKPTLRFFALPIALCAAMAAVAVESWAARLRYPWALTVGSSVVTVCLVWTLMAGEGAREFARWRAEQIPVHRAAGRFLGERMAPGSWLATGNAGLIPYTSRQPTIDIVGLCDRQIALRDVPEMGKAIAGHGKGDGDYVLSRRPEVILFQNARFSDRPLRPADVERRLFSLSEREMWQDERLHERYRLVNERLPGFYFNFFERKDD